MTETRTSNSNSNSNSNLRRFTNMNRPIKEAHVRFDEYLDLSEVNMRKSCKRLMSRLYSASNTNMHNSEPISKSSAHSNCNSNLMHLHEQKQNTQDNEYLNRVHQCNEFQLVSQVDSDARQSIQAPHRPSCNQFTAESNLILSSSKSLTNSNSNVNSNGIANMPDFHIRELSTSTIFKNNKPHIDGQENHRTSMRCLDPRHSHLELRCKSASPSPSSSGFQCQTKTQVHYVGAQNDIQDESIMQNEIQNENDYHDQAHDYHDENTNDRTQLENPVRRRHSKCSYLRLDFERRHRRQSSDILQMTKEHALREHEQNEMITISHDQVPSISVHNFENVQTYLEPSRVGNHAMAISDLKQQQQMQQESKQQVKMDQTTLNHIWRQSQAHGVNDQVQNASSNSVSSKNDANRIDATNAGDLQTCSNPDARSHELSRRRFFEHLRAEQRNQLQVGADHQIKPDESSSSDQVLSGNLTHSCSPSCSKTSTSSSSQSSLFSSSCLPDEGAKLEKECDWQSKLEKVAPPKSSIILIDKELCDHECNSSQSNSNPTSNAITSNTTNTTGIDGPAGALVISAAREEINRRSPITAMFPGVVDVRYDGRLLITDCRSRPRTKNYPNKSVQSYEQNCSEVKLKEHKLYMKSAQDRSNIDKELDNDLIKHYSSSSSLLHNFEIQVPRGASGTGLIVKQVNQDHHDRNNIEPSMLNFKHFNRIRSVSETRISKDEARDNEHKSLRASWPQLAISDFHKNGWQAGCLQLDTLVASRVKSVHDQPNSPQSLSCNSDVQRLPVSTGTDEDRRSTSSSSGFGASSSEASERCKVQNSSSILKEISAANRYQVAIQHHQHQLMVMNQHYEPVGGAREKHDRLECGLYANITNSKSMHDSCTRIQPDYYAPISTYSGYKTLKSLDFKDKSEVSAQSLPQRGRAYSEHSLESQESGGFSRLLPATKKGILSPDKQYEIDGSRVHQSRMHNGSMVLLRRFSSLIGRAFNMKSSSTTSNSSRDTNSNKTKNNKSNETEIMVNTSTDNKLQVLESTADERRDFSNVRQDHDILMSNGSVKQVDVENISHGLVTCSETKENAVQGTDLVVLPAKVIRRARSMRLLPRSNRKHQDRRRPSSSSSLSSIHRIGTNQASSKQHRLIRNQKATRITAHSPIRGYKQYPMESRERAKPARLIGLDCKPVNLEGQRRLHNGHSMLYANMRTNQAHCDKSTTCSWNSSCDAKYSNWSHTERNLSKRNQWLATARPTCRRPSQKSSPSKRAPQDSGRLLSIDEIDGSLLVELERANLETDWSFAVALGALNQIEGIFVSRIHHKALTGLLGVGDRLLTLDGRKIGTDVSFEWVIERLNRKRRVQLRVAPRCSAGQS